MRDMGIKSSFQWALCIKGIMRDSNYLYIVGATRSEGEGDRDILVMKLDKNLTLIKEKQYQLKIR